MENRWKTGLLWIAGSLLVALVVGSIIRQLMVKAFFTPERQAILSVMESSPEDKTEIDQYLKTHHIPPSDETKVLSELAAKGALRLDDTVLVRRAEIVRSVLNKLSPDECATVSKQGLAAIAQGQSFDALEALKGDTASVRWLARMGLAAAIAEIRQRPPVRLLSKAEADSALDAFVALLTPAQSERYAKAALHPDAVSPQEYCWMTRIMFDAVDRMPEQEKGVLARILATGERASLDAQNPGIRE